MAQTTELIRVVGGGGAAWAVGDAGGAEAAPVEGVAAGGGIAVAVAIGGLGAWSSPGVAVAAGGAAASS
jgi:hypothetical protein